MILLYYCLTLGVAYSSSANLSPVFLPFIVRGPKLLLLNPTKFCSPNKGSLFLPTNSLFQVLSYVFLLPCSKELVFKMLGAIQNSILLYLRTHKKLVIVFLCFDMICLSVVFIRFVLSIWKKSYQSNLLFCIGMKLTALLCYFHMIFHFTISFTFKVVFF